MRNRTISLAALLLALIAAFLWFGKVGRGRPPAPPRPVQAADVQPGIFLKQPLPLHRVEQDTEALAIWRRFSARRPTLLLLSDDLVRLPVPGELWPQAAELAARGTPEEIARRASAHSPDPLLLPGMAVDSALRSGWFGQVVWVLPLREPDKPLAEEDLRRKLLDNRLITAAEAENFTVRGQRILGALGGIPLAAAPLPHLPELTGPVIVHIDQSYFQKLYRNEIATPLFPLVHHTLTALRDRGISTLAATFCSGNLDGRIPLDARFVGEFLAGHVERPETVDRPVQANWRRHSEALYLANFFQKERILELNRALEKEAPEAAWVKYSLFRSAVNHKDAAAALGYLAKAVALDRMYALEYLDLADRAYEKKRPDEALRMLTLASEALPEIPRIRLKTAQLLQETGDRQSALILVEELRKLPWSTVYHPDMPGYLAGFASALRRGPEDVPGKQPGAPTPPSP